MISPTIYKPRPSHGWVWLVLISLALLVLTVGVTIPAWAEMPPGIIVMNLVIGLGFGLPGLALAYWFRTMQYELDDAALTLRCGPVLHYRIPLDEIRNIKRRNLAITLWSSMRLPGLALFNVLYADVGVVKMCATAAADRILLIETDKTKYGLTPADEEGLVAALRARMEG